MTDPHGGSSRPPPQAFASGRPRRWLPLVLLGVLAVVVAVVVAAQLVDRQGSAGPRGRTVPATAAALSPSELEGRWSGEGSRIRCAGLEDEGCSGTRPVTLTIDCSEQPCVVTPFDRSYGSPPLRFEDGRYRATGPVPAEVAPTCGGVPTRSALWRLELVVGGGRLGGTYAESTVQGFDCGATGVAWNVVLERS